MEIGPLIPTDFNKLVEILANAGHPYESFVDEEVRKNPKLAQPTPDSLSYPTHEPPRPYLFLRVPSHECPIFGRHTAAKPHL